MNNKILSIAIAAVTSVPVMALTADDYCNPSINTPKKIKEMRPLNDGVSFAALSDDEKAIEVYSYKTGEKISTLFSIGGIKGEVKIDNFDGYVISQNEKKILLWTNTKKLYRNSFYADYYVYDIFRSTLQPVSTEGAQRGAVMSHDGRMVAYVRDNNVHISTIDYKSDKAITSDGKINEIIYGVPDWAYEEEFGIETTFRWSGDDNVLAFVRYDESKVPVYSFDEYGIYSPDNILGDIYPKEYSYKYPLAGYPNSQVEVYAYNINMQTLKKMDLPIGLGYVVSLEFDGKGVSLMAMLLNRDQNEMSLYKVNPGSTVANLVISEKSRAWLSPNAYQMVKYYDDSFVIGSEQSGYRHLYEYDYNGNLKRQLTKGEWNVTDYYGKNKSGVHFIQNTQKGAINRNIASIDNKGNVTLLNDIEGTEMAEFSSNFEYYLRSYSNAVTPPTYSIYGISGKLIKNLELNESYASKYSSSPKMEFLKVKNEDGQDMDAFMLKPSGFDPSKKYPLLMYQYNGPDSQLVLNAWKMDGIYYLASQGYVVCAVDGRGSGNRNREWATCVYKQLGYYETIDQLTAADYFASQSFIDPSKTACFGWSYGGYMTLMETAHERSKFKAGISMAPVTDWRFYDSIYTERYMSTPQQNGAGYIKASALEKSQGVNAKLLVMTGTNDDNVHMYNTLRYTSKLNYEGKIFDMMVYSGFEHSLRMGNARTQLYKKIEDFLNLNVKN